MKNHKQSFSFEITNDQIYKALKVILAIEAAVILLWFSFVLALK